MRELVSIPGFLLLSLLGSSLALRGILLRRLLLSFFRPLAVAVKAKAKGQTEDLRGSPLGKSDHQTQHNPVVSPTGDRLGLARHQRVVMHSCSVDHQAAFPSQRVVDRQLDYAGGREHANKQQQQVLRENVQAPGVLTEKAVVVREVSLLDRSTRYDQVGDEAMAM